jgi:hypothetical protein
LLIVAILCLVFASKSASKRRRVTQPLPASP